MMNFADQQKEFTRIKNRKALAYTAGICAVILLLFILISWKDAPPAPPVAQDLLEINLGNDAEGFGEEQPLVKGEMGKNEETPVVQPNQVKEDVPTEVIPDENAASDAAPVRKPEKVIPKLKKEPNTVTTPAPVTPKPAPKPKLVYNGPANGKGNNAATDNGYTMQGNKPGGKGDAGSPTGNPDSYGNTPGGKVGGPRVIRGNRRITSFPSFTGDLAKATIYAEIKVTANGSGTFIKLVKPSTSFNSGYANAISGYLRNIKFNAGDEESTVTVQFNFQVN